MLQHPNNYSEKLLPRNSVSTSSQASQINIRNGVNAQHRHYNFCFLNCLLNDCISSKFHQKIKLLVSTTSDDSKNVKMQKNKK